MMDEQGTPFYELRHDGEPKTFVRNFDYVDIGNRVRLFYKRYTDPLGNEKAGYGFKFNALEIVSYDGDDVPWGQSTRCDNLIYGNAMFDGLRHTHTGEDGNGYVFYPDAQVMCAIWRCLLLLEVRFCSKDGVFGRSWSALEDLEWRISLEEAAKT